MLFVYYFIVIKYVHVFSNSLTVGKLWQRGGLASCHTCCQHNHRCTTSSAVWGPWIWLTYVQDINKVLLLLRVQFCFFTQVRIWLSLCTLQCCVSNQQMVYCANRPFLQLYCKCNLEILLSFYANGDKNGVQWHETLCFIENPNRWQSFFQSYHLGYSFESSCFWNIENKKKCIFSK